MWPTPSPKHLPRQKSAVILAADAKIGTYTVRILVSDRPVVAGRKFLDSKETAFLVTSETGLTTTPTTQVTSETTITSSSTSETTTTQSMSGTSTTETTSQTSAKETTTETSNTETTSQMSTRRCTTGPAKLTWIGAGPERSQVFLKELREYLASLAELIVELLISSHELSFNGFGKVVKSSICPRPD